MRAARLSTGILLAVVVLAGCSGRPVASLKTGECFDFDRAAQDVSSVEIIECSQPHVAEVFAVFNVNLDAYDATAIAAAADEKCLSAFEPYAGIPYAAATYYYRTLAPTEESWAGGARSVVCFVYPVEGTLDASIKKSDA